jgi:site-specific DNA-adenine methylase
MQPFFLYYGGKWRLAERLGPPQRAHVIEPFAGSAGYCCYWEPKKVTLIDADPVVVGVWKFLKRVSPAELRRLPSNISHVDELPPRVCAKRQDR